MGAKLIFVNGADRSFFTEDGITFKNLVAVIERGTTTAGTDTDSLQDTEVTNWVNDTNVAVGDIIYNQSVSAYAVITAITTASVQHSPIGTTQTGIGQASRVPATGDAYEIQDSVELNIIPGPFEPDNTAALIGSSSATGIYVSGMSNWLGTEIRVGDWIRNTTKEVLTAVTAITSAHVRCHGVSGQSSGDTVIFLKSAQPIATRAHVHFGRLYLIDERDERLVRISGANNPEDMTTDAGTLDSASFKFGELQPEGDSLVGMDSFQRFIVFFGKQNIYLFQGTTPIADTATSTLDFSIVGLFPKGAIGRHAEVSLGNDLVFIS